MRRAKCIPGVVCVTNMLSLHVICVCILALFGNFDCLYGVLKYYCA